jgi:hypothetical protein
MGGLLPRNRHTGTIQQSQILGPAQRRDIAGTTLGMTNRRIAATGLCLTGGKASARIQSQQYGDRQNVRSNSQTIMRP